MRHADDDDRDLRELFAQTRAEDQRLAGDFPAVLAAAASRRTRRQVLARRTVAALAAASVVIAAAYVALRERPLSPRPDQQSQVLTFDPSSTHWESPTDFLLTTPGDSLLRALPVFRYLDPSLPSLTTPSRTVPAPSARRLTS